jgi:hypothetical protein
MRDTQVIMHMSVEALRALAHYYECTAEILRRRADAIDPPPRINRQAEADFFLSIPEFVAEKQRDGADLDRAIDLVCIEHGATRARVEYALVAARRREKSTLRDLRIQQARAMKAAGATDREIGRALGVTPQYAGRLAMKGGTPPGLFD